MAVSVEQQLSEAKATIVSLTKEVKDLKEAHAVVITEKDGVIAGLKKNDEKRELASLIEKNNLTEAHAKIVNTQFEKGLLSTPELMKDVVESYKQEKKIVRSNGGTRSTQDSDGKEELRESEVPVLMRSYGISETEARTMLGLPTSKERK